MSAAAINVILEKVASKDKDFRYMATSDLLNELSKDTFQVDPELERKLCNVVAVQLEDQSGDISGLAVKCLGVLVRKVGEARVMELVKGLCEKVAAPSKKDSSSRDIASIGLKTVIEVAGGSLAHPAAALICSRMLDGVTQKDNFEVLTDSLDILTDVVAKFGHLLPEQHATIVQLLQPYLDDSRQGIRKRALHCIGALSPCLSDAQLDAVAQHKLGQLKGGALKPDTARSYVQGVGALSKAVGYRFGRHLTEAVPLMVQYGQKAAEGDDELREYALQALESFVSRSPADARPFLEQLLAEALRYIKYDPNYAADDMDEDGGEGGSDEDDDDGSEEEYSDDEDMSWKVRRAAAKLLSALVHAYPDQLADIYSKAAGELVARFREREENVKADVFAAHCDLLRQVGIVSGRYDATDPASPLQLLLRDVGPMLKAAARQLADKSPKTRMGMFTVLRTLVGVLPGSVADHVGMLVPGILLACKDKSASSSSLKIEALTFLRAAMESNAPPVFQQHVAQLSSGVFAAVGERYYKVAAEALRVCEQMVSVIRPNPPAPTAPELAPVVAGMFSCINGRLAAQDQDQEVKECAILCMAHLVATCGDLLSAEVRWLRQHSSFVAIFWARGGREGQEVKECAILCMAHSVATCGDLLSAEVPGVLKLLLERLRNEITRLPAVKGFAILAHSQLELGLDGALEPVIAELTSFLRKANRLLRQAALAALEALVAKYGPSLDPASTSALLAESSSLISDADLSIAALSLKLAVTLLRQQPAVAQQVVERVLPAGLVLVRSPLLQGAALAELQALFPALAGTGSPAAKTEALLSALLDEGRGRRDGGGSTDGSARQAQHSVAQCCAVLVVPAGQAQVDATVKQLLQMLKSADQASQRLALLCLGEIGRRTDLSSAPNVESAVNASLSSENEDIRAAASLALGGVACGNLGRFLPALLQSIEGASGQSKQQYLLLQALNEVVTTVSARKAADTRAGFTEAQVQQVLDLLVSCSRAEEECRNVVAECLGRLALLHPSEVLARLRTGLSSDSEHTRCVVVGAVKYMVVDKPHPVDDLLKDCLLDFLMLMKDPDRHVRKAAVVALSAVVHHKPGLVAAGLEQLLPLLYDQTAIKPEMIRTVDLGPFKHRIDDGLELRKAAFECLDILLTALPHVLQQQPDFLAALESGLKDHQDVKAPAHLMLVKLAASPGGGPAVLSQLDKLVEPLEKTLTAKLKSDAVKQEVDRHEELLRSCLRAVDALNRLPGSEASAPFTGFLKRTVMSGPLREKFLAAQAERQEAEGEAMEL
uniref:TATA-binding protein interacting (TIP20) domain-containing protein n=1 Tax=Tetradesmus obliquus TaxID=3088 RepID=A0A383VAE3_TETOB